LRTGKEELRERRKAKLVIEAVMQGKMKNPPQNEKGQFEKTCGASLF